MDQLHPSAIKSINENAERLISFFKQSKSLSSKKEKTNTATKRKNEIYTPITITDKDIIGEVSFGYCNIFGDETGKIFTYLGNEYVLVDEGYLELDKLAEKIYNIGFSEFMSVEYIKENLFLWMKKKFMREDILSEYVEFLSVEGKKDIGEYRVLIPIPYTTTVANFKIGKIEFQTLKESEISSRFDFGIANALTEKEKRERELFKQEIQRKYQGYLVGVFLGIGEKERVIEQAYFHLDSSLSILRLISGANFTPRLLSIVQQYGKILRKKEYFVFDTRSTKYEISESLENKNINYLHLSNYQLKALDEISKINTLLNETKQNNFNEKLLEAILIYSKHSLHHSISDNLLYIIVGLETILLRNNSEPIQQNIAERIAFLIGDSKQERKEIINVFKKIYALRSQFVHHGKNPSHDEIVLIETFMNYTWLTFCALINLIDTMTTKDELIAELEDRKLM